MTGPDRKHRSMAAMKRDALCPLVGRPETYTSESIAPKRSESIWRELRVTDRVHDVAVSEIRLDRARVHAVVREVETGRVPQHVRMDRELNTGLASGSRDQFAHRRFSHRPATLGGK